MDREFHIVIERDSGGYYVASVPTLPGCHTQARSLDEPLRADQGGDRTVPGSGRRDHRKRWISSGSSGSRLHYEQATGTDRDCELTREEFALPL